MTNRDETTILVVDDEIDMRMLVRVVIELANHGLTIVGEAGDGHEAMEAWREMDGPPVPDVIILDNRMPNVSGLEVARQILGERPEQTIILYTAFLDDGVRQEAADIGIAACVSKDNTAGLPDLIRRLRVD